MIYNAHRGAQVWVDVVVLTHDGSAPDPHFGASAGVLHRSRTCDPEHPGPRDSGVRGKAKADVVTVRQPSGPTIHAPISSVPSDEHCNNGLLVARAYATRDR